MIGAMLLAAASTAYAEDRPTFRFMRVDAFADAFNAAAKREGVAVRAIKTTCTAQAAAVCRYSLGEFLEAIISGAAVNAPVRDIVIANGAPKGRTAEAARAVVAYLVAIQLLSREADPVTRMETMKALMRGLLSKDEEGAAELGGVRYTLSTFKGVGGVLLFAEPIE